MWAVFRGWVVFRPRAFRWVAVLPTILIFIFGAIAVSDRLRGGYQAVHLPGVESTTEEGLDSEATPL